MALGVLLRSPGALAEPTDAELAARLGELDRDAAHRSALSGPLAKARHALERSRGGASAVAWAQTQPATGRQAALLRSLAAKWLDVARDLVRAMEAEKAADAAERALDDVETKIVRGKALLEETVARRSRTQAELDALDKPKPEPPPAAVPTSKAKPAAPAPSSAGKPEPHE